MHTPRRSRAPRLRAVLLTAALAVTVGSFPPVAVAAPDHGPRPTPGAGRTTTALDPVAHLPQNPRASEVHGPKDMLGWQARGRGRAKDLGKTPREHKPRAASSDVEIAATQQFSGQVVDARGVGFQAQLFIRSDPDGVFAGGQTAADGTFDFAVEQGAYTVLVQDMTATFTYGAWGPAGFAYLTGAVDQLVIDTTDVTAEIIVPDAVLLSGRVTGNGSNLGGIEVDVFLDNALAAIASTDSDGTWVAPVRPGAYTIGFYTGGTSFGDGWLGTSGFVPNYGAAKVLAIGTSNVSVGTTALPATRTVSGKVVDPYSLGRPGAQVEAFVNDEFYGLVTANSNGAFNVKVPPGNLKLWMFDPTGLFAPGWRTSTSLTNNPAGAAVTVVGGSNVSGVTIKTKDARVISGSIYTVPCQGCQSSGIQTFIQAESYGIASSFAVTNDQGNFYMPVLDGGYRLWTDGRDNQYSSLAGGYYRSGNVITPERSLATVVTVSLGSPQNVNVQTTVKQLLTGIVLDTHGWTLPHIQAQAFVNGTFYAYDDADVGGVFHLPLLAGTFRLAFVDLEGGYVAGWLGATGWVADIASAKDVVVTDFDPSDISIEMPVDAPPPAPTGVTATPYHQSAGVSWNAVASTANRPIIHYTAIASPGGERCVVTGATSCIIAGLTNGTPYTFRVTAASTVGTSGLSTASGSVQPKAVPDSPGSVVAVGTGSSIDLTWAAPADNGSAVTGYTATASPGGKTCTSSGATACTMTGVADGLYSVTVSATNGNGTGPPSARTSVRVDTVAPTAGAPTAALAVGAATGSTVPLTLSWSGSDAGSGIDHYEVWQQSNGGAWALIGAPTASTFVRSAGPSSTSTKRFRVRAFDKKGNVSAFAYGPTIKVIRYQQNASGVTYSGTWTTSSTTSASGGSHRTTSTAGRSVSFAFSGRSIAAIGLKASGYGQLKVYVDGVYKVTMNEYSTSTQWRRVVASLNVSSGSHTIKLVCVGNAGHPKISIDAFVVIK